MTQNFIVAGHCGFRYAFPALAVREIVWLPALSRFDELPDHIAGAFDLRGRVVPVLDLALRFGRTAHPRRESDQVVVVDQGEHRLGVLVDELFDVLSAEEVAVEPAERYQVPGGQARFIRGALRQDGELVMLLDIPALLAEAPDLAPIIPAPETVALAEDLLQRRARELALVPETTEGRRLTSCALVRLGSELFGLELGWIDEFAHLNGRVPIPRAPAPIAGIMNLRGDLLTLIDVRSQLGLSASAVVSEVVVVELDTQRFGLLVEAIEDVVDVAPEQIAANPRAQQAEAEPFCSGVARVNDWIFSVLEPSRLVSSPDPSQGTGP